MIKILCFQYYFGIIFVDFIVFSIFYYGDSSVNILKVKTKS